MTILIDVDPGLFEGPTLSHAESVTSCHAPEGTYVALTAMTPPYQALVPKAKNPSHPVAVVLTLDDLFEDRIDAAREVWRAIRRGTRAVAAPFTAQRRNRLKLLLRALDASLLGVGYREIARGLFGDQVRERDRGTPNSLKWAVTTSVPAAP